MLFHKTVHNAKTDPDQEIERDLSLAHALMEENAIGTHNWCYPQTWFYPFFRQSVLLTQLPQPGRQNTMTSRKTGSFFSLRFALDY